MSNSDMVKRVKRPSRFALAAVMAFGFTGSAAAGFEERGALPSGFPFVRVFVPPSSALDDRPVAEQMAAAPRLKSRAICGLIERNALDHGLPPSFLARLIWKESRFDTKAVSPAGALGIAQFIPATAKQEGLANPFDPAQAIAVSAKHLSDMRRRFGNLGLAAIGYNAGPGRAAAFVGGNAWLPAETADYVASILGRDAEAYQNPGNKHVPRPLKAGVGFLEACGSLPVIRASVRSPMVSARSQPWHVQVSGHFARHVAVKMFKRTQRKHRDILGKFRPVVVKERGKAGQRTQNTVRVGAASRAAAAEICRRLRTRGAFCLVKKNGA